MRILAVDTTTAAGSLAAMETAEGPPGAPRVRACVFARSDEAYSTRLFRQLEFLLGELQWTTDAIDLYAVASGPGSFTALRVGLAAVKGWAEVHGKPIAAVSSLEALAWEAWHTAPRGSRLVPLADARRGEIYAGIYQQNGDGVTRFCDDMVMSSAELWPHLLTLGGPAPEFVASDATFARAVLAGSPFASQPVVEVTPVLSPAVGRAGWLRHQRGETCDAFALDAHYVRRSDAEMQWKE
jgi:tRNA threonylcarbamoyladenosine biosynthesis protein TsaB